jgi:hypothetical protein
MGCSIQEQRLVLYAAVRVERRGANHMPLLTSQLRCVQQR